MKRNLYFTLSFLFLLLLCSCQEILKNLPGYNGEIRAIALGYITELEGSDRDFEDNGTFDDANFVAFSDQASFDSARENASGQDYNSSIVPDADLGRNRFLYQEGEVALKINTYPKGVNVKNISIKSSNPEIMEIVKTEGADVTVVLHNIGDVDVQVSVEGSQNSLEATYPIRIVSKTDVQFYITPYWWGGVATRLRYRIEGVPYGFKDLVYEVKDSVSVVGYCEYYNLKESKNPIVVRDTVRYAMHDNVHRFKKNRRHLIRNITDAIRQFKLRTSTGYIIERYDNGEPVYRQKDFDWIPEQVILDFCIVSNSPYIEFNFYTKYDRTTETYDKDKGQMVDEGTDEDDYEDDSVGDKKELSKSDKAYFQILLNTFTGYQDRQDMMNNLNKDLLDLGYDSELSEEEKDRQMEEINKHRKDGDE